MPRGVYDRSKARKRGEGRSTQQSHGRSQNHGHQQQRTQSGGGSGQRMTKTSSDVSQVRTQQTGDIDVVNSFGILGANLTTLSESLTRIQSLGLQDNSAVNLIDVLSREINETVQTMTLLRQTVFSGFDRNTNMRRQDARGDVQDIQSSLPQSGVVPPILPGNATGFPNASGPLPHH